MSDNPGADGSTKTAPALESVFERLAAGDPEALAEVYDACAGRLYAVALWRTGSREDAADVVQEVFVRLARDGRRLGEARRPLAYLLRMAHNIAVSTLRGRRVERPVDDLLLTEPGASAEERFAARQAAAMLARLPAAQREALYLRFFEGLGYRQIGAVTGVPTFTAAGRCRLGLARLRRLMGGRP